MNPKSAIQRFDICQDGEQCGRCVIYIEIVEGSVPVDVVKAIRYVPIRSDMLELKRLQMPT